MTTTVDNPFAAPADAMPSERNKILRGGRYRLPNRDGSHHSGGWTRVTNVVGCLSDQYALRDWELRNLLTGLALEPRLFARGQELVALVEGDADGLKPHTEAVAELLEACKDAAGGGRGAAAGTRKHAMVEAHHRDLPFVTTDMERIFLRKYQYALVAANLEALPGMQERRVMIESANACGTLDNLLRDLISGLVHVGDLKSQKRFWTWIEIEAQEAGYAHADAMWEPVEGVWLDMPPVDRTQGAVLWMPDPQYHPSREPSVEVMRVDLERGWRSFQLAHTLHGLRSECSSKRQAVSGTAWTPVVPTAQRWAARLLSVESPEEGSRVWAEIEQAGAVCAELRQTALKVAERFAPISA